MPRNDRLQPMSCSQIVSLLPLMWPPSSWGLTDPVPEMRDDLKGRSLTFTEIAKLVGENWQSLSPSEKEPFETQALKAKEKYNSDLAEYKKTSEYRKYMQYLHDFRQKQASQNQG